MNLKQLAIAAVVSVSFTAFSQASAAEPAKPAAAPAKAADPAKPAEPAKGAAAAAPAAGAAVAAPPMPTLPPEGKKWIEGHLGNWKSSDVTMTMGDKTFKGKMDMKCEKTSAGWATLCRGKANMGKEMPVQEITMLAGWNIGDGMATMYEMTNMGEVHNHTGKWTDDKTITVTHQGKTFEGKDEKDAFTITWVSPKEMQMKAEGISGTTTNWSFTATAKK